MIPDGLRSKARAAADQLAEAERQMQAARREYHRIVRRMHLAGASLREIAQALDLSHQRVQQMVGEAGGTWWQRVWRTRSAKSASCTFCDRPSTVVERLIAGPRVFICDACVTRAEENFPTGGTPPGSHARARCSFCAKRQTPERRLLVGPPGNICSECLEICRQILIDSAA